MRYYFSIAILFIACGCSESSKPSTQVGGEHPSQSHGQSTALASKSGQRESLVDPALSSKFVTLSEVPKLRLTDSPAVTYSDDHISKLIASLAGIESPDFGFSQTLSGHAFLALQGKSSADAFLLTDHKVASSEALTELVKIGPAALPALLEHLDDDTPTKLKIKHGGGSGGMWFANELWGNPINKVEQSVLQARPQNERDFFGSEHVDAYTVKVGDICLVAIGQITGRGYQTVRYQPTACIILNSPTHDPELCAQVRAMWKSDNPRQKLLNSLLLDYATRGKFNGKSLDGWSVGSSLQVEAAMRLLYYFPTETSALIADRIDRLNVARTGPPSDRRASESELDAFTKREVANGVRTVDFIAATAWSQHLDIIAAIKRVADRTDDVDILKIVDKIR